MTSPVELGGCSGEEGLAGGGCGEAPSPASTNGKVTRATRLGAEMAVITKGKRCTGQACTATEAQCANQVRTNGCCPDCSHWDGYDIYGNPWRPVTVRTTPIPHGTEAGYRLHLRNKHRACDDCRRAHARHNDMARYLKAIR